MNDLTTQQLLFLLYVKLHPNSSMEEIAKAIHIKPGTVSRLSRLFGEKGDRTKPGLGMVEFNVDYDNNRIKRVKLNKKGEVFFQRLQKRSKWFNDVIAELQE